MSERNPHSGYRSQQPGEHPGQFETDAQTWRAPVRLLAQTVTGVGVYAPARVTVEATKPDARVNLRLTIGFRPEQGGEDALDFAIDPMVGGGTVRGHLVLPVIWLAACDSYGAGLRECEDLVGTEAVPVQMVSDGCWGAIYEVDVDCKAVRARIDLAHSGIAGRWLATAKWVAVSPMSDRDWLHAREKMQLNVQPNLPILDTRAAPT